MGRAAVLAVAACILTLTLAPGLVRAAAPATGFIEVCKGSDGSGVTGTFRFTVGTQTVVVPVDACSAPLRVPAGIVTVVEETVAGVGVVEITASPAGRLVSSSLPGRSAEVTVVAGDIATQTVVTFTNRSEVGILTVCKAAGNGITPGTNFTFVVGGVSIAVAAGTCVTAGRFPYGSNVTVTELLEPGVRVASIAVQPEARLVGAPSLTDGTVTVQIGMLVTQVTFTNETTPQGLVQICKRSVDAGVTGSFTFTVAGQTIEVPVGGCSGTLRVAEGVHTVTELPRAGAVVTGVATSPPSRLVGTNLAARSAEVQVVAGSILQMVTVTFTNQLQTSQVKVCKVAGRGVTVGTPFSFTVGGIAVTVPAGSCVVAGTFPVSTVVQVTEAIPPGMEVSAIRVDPPDRRSGAAALATGSVSVMAGPGVTEVMVTNQTTISPTTTVPPTSSTVPFAATTTTAVPVLPTTTSTTAVPPLVTTTTAPAPTTSTTAVPFVATTTTVTAPTTSTTAAPLLATTTTAPAPTTSTTAPVATTSTAVPLLATTTTTAANISATTTIVSPATTTTTAANISATTTIVSPAPTATTSTTVPLTATTTPVSPSTTTTAPAIQPVSSTVPPPGATSTTSPPSTTTTTAPVELSPVTTIVGQVIERASVPLSTARLALTGAPTSLLVAISLVVVLLGLVLVSVAGAGSASAAAVPPLSAGEPDVLPATAAKPLRATAARQARDRQRSPADHAFSRGSPDRPG